MMSIFFKNSFSDGKSHTDLNFHSGFFSPFTLIQVLKILFKCIYKESIVWYDFLAIESDFKTNKIKVVIKF